MLILILRSSLTPIVLDLKSVADRQVDLHSEPQPVPESAVGVAVLSMLVLPNKP